MSDGNTAGLAAFVRREDPTSPVARACVQAYMDELGRLFPDGFAPSGGDEVDFHGLTPPDGDFLVVDLNGQALGCGALRRLPLGDPIEPATAEIKRMWVSETLRGQGMGSRLLQALEDSARDLGIERIRLDTSKYLEAAVLLYRRAGYIEVLAYNTNPYAHHWFEKRLGPRRTNGPES